MESLTATLIFKPENELSLDTMERIKDFFRDLKQVSVLCLEKDCIRIEYYPQLYSPDYLEQGLTGVGVRLSKPEKRPGVFKRFIDKLARDNKKSFGDTELDCCKLPKHWAETIGQLIRRILWNYFISTCDYFKLQTSQIFNLRNLLFLLKFVVIDFYERLIITE